jgi:hypothetical protein
VKYIHLQRDSDFELGGNADVFNRFLYRFDAAPLKRDTLKLVVDTNPLPLLDLGFEVNLKRSDYHDTLLGRQKDKREEISLSAAYGDAAVFRVSAFADWEHTKYDSNHWTGAVATFPNPTASAYFWSSDVQDRNWLVGIAGDWPMSDKLRFYAAAIWQKGDGGVDFTAPAATNPQNITNYDDFTKRTLNLRAVYRVQKNLELTLGAAYEKYTYTDIQLDGYLYAIRTGANQNFLGGAYANPSYRASIVYGLVAWRF